MTEAVKRRTSPSVDVSSIPAEIREDARALFLKIRDRWLASGDDSFDVEVLSKELGWDLVRTTLAMEVLSLVGLMAARS